MAKSIYGTNGWDRVDIYADLCPGAVRGFQKGGGRDFKCCCVQENFEKLTLSGAFSDHFLRKGGGGEGPPPPPLTAYDDHEYLHI